MKPEKVKVWTEDLLRYAEDLSEKLDGLAGVNVTALIASHRALSVQLDEKDKELKELQEGFQQVNADYKALTDIMDRTRRLAYLASEEEERPRFHMDANGNLTRIEDGE